jgi:hypothetical protein
MPKLYQTKIWQASLPDGWEARSQYFDCATFFKPDGVGQISVMVFEPEFQGLKREPGVNEQFFGKLKGSTWTQSASRTFGRFWCLSCKSRWLLVNYTCAPTFAQVEQSEVDEILQSMAESDAPAG